MDTLTKKTLTTKRGLTYTYYTLPATPTKPTLLLQHGFPDSAAEWSDLITTHLAPLGYGAIAVDQLGYGGTSKPTDPAAYKFSAITADLIDILDAEGLDKVVSLGHDWGSLTAQLLYNLHPDRVSGLVLVNVGYSGASAAKFDLDGIIAQTQKMFGYGFLWYWKFFAAEDGARLFEQNLDVGFDLLHTPEVWKDILCTENGVRKFVESGGEGYNLKRRAYATENMKKAFVERLSRDGLEGPMCWYKSNVFGHQDGDANPENNVVNVPTLFIGYNEDIAPAEALIQPAIQAGYLPQLTLTVLDGAHWGLVEHPKEFGETVTGWLRKSYK